MNTTTNLPETVMEEAIVWFDDLRSDGVSDCPNFAEWLTRSPTHIEAFLAVSTLHDGLSAVGMKDGSWLAALLDDIESNDDVESNVVPLIDQEALPKIPTATSEYSRGQSIRRWSGLSAMLVVSVGLAIGFWWLGTDIGPPKYSTGLGEQRSIVLEDGSVMQLNTNSVVTVRFTEGAREIRLTQGEAIFDVEEHPTWPFRVLSGAVKVEALGTRFNVYRHAEEIQVTVTEGRVAVESADSRGTARTMAEYGEGAIVLPSVVAKTVEVGAGQRLTIRPGGAIADILIPVDTQRTTAWTERRVVFEDDTLDSVVAEFNRYNRTRFVINDPGLRSRRISGIFTVDDPEAFVEVLSSMAPVRAIGRTDGSVEIVIVD